MDKGRTVASLSSWPLLALALLVLAQAFTAQAAPHPAGSSGAAHGIEARVQQRRFLREAAAAAQAQVIAGKLASVHGSTPEVRSYGRQMMDAGQKAGRELVLLSLQTQVPVSSRPGSKDRPAIARLRSLRGDAFDRLFLQHFAVDLQEREVALYRSMLATAGAEPGLLHLAQQMVPALRQQLAAAHALQKEDGAPSSLAASAPQAGASRVASPNAQQLLAARNAGADADVRDAMENVIRAADVLRKMKEDSHMDALLQDARGVLIFPQYRRGAVVLGVRMGQGVLVSWHGNAVTPPAFFRMEGGSIGVQAGAARGGTVYLLMTDAAVQQFRSDAQLSFDLQLGATLGWNSDEWQASVGKVRDVVVWSGARGAYAGAAVGVTQIVADGEANRAYYGREVTPGAIVGGEMQNPYERVLERLLGS
jgi:lipid-binding SYLF domain-containing protein/predicted outer membrane protein